MDGFSAHFELSESISVDFDDFSNFAIDSCGLTLFSEGPRTLRDCPEGPGTTSILFSCRMRAIQRLMDTPNHLISELFKGASPIVADPGGFPDFRIF